MTSFRLDDVRAWCSSLLGGAAFALVALILLLLPLPVGSNRVWAVMSFSLFAYAAAALALAAWALRSLGRRDGSRHWLWYLAMAVWLAWLAWIGAQMLPLGDTWLQQLAPHQLQLYRQLTDVVGADAVPPRSISVALELTQQHFLESAAYVALFLAISLLCVGSSRRKLLLLWVIFLAAIAQAVYGSLMTLSGLEYGAFTKKTHYLGSATGTFINRNHFAGYMELGLACGLGLLMAYGRAEGTGWRVMLRNWILSGGPATAVRLLMMFLVIGLITSRSRGGSAAAVAGLGAALLLTLMLARNGLSWRRGAVLLLGFLMVDVALLGTWFGGGLMERFIATSPETEYRLQLWPDLMRMIEAYRIGGSGLGTFALAYPEFHSMEVAGGVREAHNDFLQFWIEVGAVGVCILGALVLLTALHILRVLRRRHDPVALATAVAALAALLCMAVHSSTDFNLQIPANAGTLVALLALAWSTEPFTRRSRRRSSLHPGAVAKRKQNGEKLPEARASLQAI